MLKAEIRNIRNKLLPFGELENTVKCSKQLQKQLNTKDTEMQKLLGDFINFKDKKDYKWLTKKKKYY